MAVDKNKITTVGHIQQLIAKLKNYFTSKTELQKAIAEAKHAIMKKVDTIPQPEEAEENVLYLVKNETSGHFDIYIKLDEKMEWLDDTTVDLSEYYTSVQVDEKLKGKVDTEEGKGLSSNDYTSEEKKKLEGIAEQATKVEKSSTNGNIQVNGSEVQVYTLPETVLEKKDIATDEEFSELLTESFGA